LIVEERTAEITKQKDELMDAFTELKNAQSQLVQSEKMASLGELTAGIAHEIQNPLNFVNNFSEISTELLNEMMEELKSGNTEEVLALASDVKANQEKINHHGKRAGAIVKGMLQHSRTSSGKNEPTDINALCDEYLRLSYHGLRAKNKSFNADFKADLDKKLPEIKVVPQDFGRVLLNLINNAFFAVNEKSKTENKDFKPSVIVKTKLEKTKVIISVSDNGSGIPQDVKEKIFQPFFTTKPTGEGTGLGLSLSYDIVTAHGGELKVETNEGEGTEFIIILPI
jgi:C4-dicarboxylate-specific signal transduction histidine kinase